MQKQPVSLWGVQLTQIRTGLVRRPRDGTGTTGQAEDLGVGSLRAGQLWAGGLSGGAILAWTLPASLSPAL